MEFESSILLDSRPQTGSHKLVAMIASYIDSSQRWEFFLQMINTVANQSEALHAIYIGISFPSEDMQKVYEPRLGMVRSMLRGVCSVLTIKQTKTRCSQGKMWQKMVRNYPTLSDPDTWILFSDDDDLWHRHRVNMYLHGLQSISKYPPSQQLLVSNIRSKVYVTSARDTDDVKVEDIDALLKSGELELASCSHNYWDICMRGSIFCDFINLANDFMLQDPTFDVLLRYHICTYDTPNGKCIPIKPGGGVWMYFWRKHTGVCSALRHQFESTHATREGLRFAVGRRMMASLDNIEVTIKECMSKWVIGANLFRVRYDARRFARNFPVEIQRRIGMFDRKPSQMFWDKVMAGLDEIHVLDDVPNAMLNSKDFAGLFLFMDKALFNACGQDTNSYRAVKSGMSAILREEAVNYEWLPPHARAFMQAFEVA